MTANDDWLEFNTLGVDGALGNTLGSADLCSSALPLWSTVSEPDQELSPLSETPVQVYRPESFSSRSVARTTKIIPLFLRTKNFYKNKVKRKTVE